MKDEIKVSLPLFSLLYNPAILFEVHQEPQQPKILTPAERTAERIINKRRLQQVRACGGACGRAVNNSKFGSEGPRFKPRPSRCFLIQETFLHFVSLHPGVNGWILATYCWGVTLRWTSILSRGGGEAILLGMLHAKETRISSGRLGLRLECAFAFYLFTIISTW